MINYVFDGQHTIEAVALVSNSRETPVWCMIYDHLCYEHEAHIFAEQQKHHRSVAPYDTFNAHLESGSEKHLLIRDLVLSYNLELGSTQKRHGTICAIAALENIFDTYGYHVLDKALRMLVSTWEGEMYSLSDNTLNAMARLIAAYGDALNEETFKERLSKHIESPLRSATGGCSYNAPSQAYTGFPHLNKALNHSHRFGNMHVPQIDAAKAVPH